MVFGVFIQVKWLVCVFSVVVDSMVSVDCICGSLVSRFCIDVVGVSQLLVMIIVVVWLWIVCMVRLRFCVMFLLQQWLFRFMCVQLLIRLCVLVLLNFMWCLCSMFWCWVSYGRKWQISGKVQLCGVGNVCQYGVLLVISQNWVMMFGLSLVNVQVSWLLRLWLLMINGVLFWVCICVRLVGRLCWRILWQFQFCVCDGCRLLLLLLCYLCRCMVRLCVVSVLVSGRQWCVVMFSVGSYSRCVCGVVGWCISRLV